MRNVQFWFRVTMLVSLLLAGVVVVAGWINATSASEGPDAIALGVGAALLVISLAFTILLGKVVRSSAHAQRPDQRIASWQVSAAAWDAFCARDKARAAELRNVVHVFKPRAPARSNDVAVLASRGGILMDGIFLGLEPRGTGAMTGVSWLQGRPECLGFAVRVPVGGRQVSTRSVPGAFRVPITPAFRQEAATALAYFKKRCDSDQLSDPSGLRTLVRIAFWLGVPLLVVGVAGLIAASSGPLPIYVIFLSLVGLLGGSGAWVVAGVVWLAMLRKR